jgi:hypothetical protein
MWQQVNGADVPSLARDIVADCCPTTYFGARRLTQMQLDRATMLHLLRSRTPGADSNVEPTHKIVAAEGEYRAAVKLGQSADIITEHPVALQLRILRRMAEISVEKNSAIIFLHNS